MRLSAPVSFTAAAVLIPAGAFCIWRTWRHDRRFTGRAALPTEHRSAPLDFRSPGNLSDIA